VASEALLISLADQVIEMHDSRCVWSLRLADAELDERRLLIDTHQRVAALLRDRGLTVQANSVQDELEGQCLTVRLVDGPGWSVPDGQSA